MSQAKSHEEKEIPHLKDEQASGRPERHMPGIKDTLPQGMKAPVDRGDDDHHMDGVHKGNDAHIGNSGMGSAVGLLNMHAERGKHVAEVGGHKMHEHSGRHGHK